VTRFVDRGAIVAAYVGIGMAVVIAISFLLVIPIEPVYWFLAPLAGLLIGYYANSRSDRRAGPWGRILVNGLFAGVVTAITIVVLLLAVKALFFAADDGYRDASVGPPLSCTSGAGCVYARYLDLPDGPAKLASQGVTNVATFTTFYWNQQLATAETLLVVTLAGALGGAVLYGLARPKIRPEPRALA